MDRYSDGTIKWYNKPYMTVPDNCRTDVSTPKEYGQKLLNRSEAENERI